jgi:cobalt-zinc-cadmium efflux system membrane fusion protein
MKNIIIITTCALLISACGNKKQTVPERGSALSANDTLRMTSAQMKNATIVVGALELRNISSVVKLNGKIDVPPQNLISVSVPLGGYLKSTKLLPGMHVTKGEIIAQIEDQQYVQLQQDFLLAKSRLNFATLEYERQKELNQSQASSDKITQQAQSELNAQRIMTGALAEKLKLINVNPNTLTSSNISKSIHIYSAINGYVSKVNVNIGKFINPSDVLFELVNPTDIHLNLKVHEKDVNSLAIGQKLMAYSNSNPDKKYPCAIILIAKDISADGISEVHCHFENYDKMLLPGMYMNAEIELDNSAVNALPESAIVNFEGKSYIFEEVGNRSYLMRGVSLGTKENGFVSIINAPEFVGKRIVLNGAYTLLMKLKNKED